MRKLFCARCRREYFSAARLMDLTNKSCECGGELKPTENQENEERKDDSSGNQRS